MKTLLLPLSLAALSAVPTVALATSKSLECERYQITANRKEPLYRYAITADFDTSLAKVELVDGPKDGKTAEPMPVGPNWKIVWRSSDMLRAVAVQAGDPKEWSDSPVNMIDLDFAKGRIQDSRAGGLLDFDEIVSNPWKTDCKRLD